MGIFADNALGLIRLMAFGLFVSAGSAHLACAADCGSLPAAGVDWQNCSKKNIVLQGNDFEKSNLAEADFSMTDLSATDLTGANLEKATMVRSWLTGAKAEKANFSRIEAYRSSFAKVSAPGANFVGAELQRANFSEASLTGANFEKAELSRVNFQRSVLTGVRFALANLSRADLRGATYEGPIEFDKAFMYLTHIEGLDLSASTDLQQSQIDLACGDQNTKLPTGLKPPAGWPCDSEQNQQAE